MKGSEYDIENVDVQHTKTGERGKTSRAMLVEFGLLDRIGTSVAPASMSGKDLPNG